MKLSQGCSCHGEAGKMWVKPLSSRIPGDSEDEGGNAAAAFLSFVNLYFSFFP